jgi:hypothetical protein
MANVFIEENTMSAIGNAIREKTGETDSILPRNMASKILGIVTGGGGGNAIRIGQNSPINILNMFYALENGTAKTGEFTIASYLPNTETLIFSSGLEEIKGYMIIDVDWEWDGTLRSKPEYTTFNFRLFDANMGFCLNNTTSAAQEDLIHGISGTHVVRGVSRCDGGDLYVKANFSHNADYTPFMINHRYIWIAW